MRTGRILAAGIAAVELALAGGLWAAGVPWWASVVVAVTGVVIAGAAWGLAASRVDAPATALEEAIRRMQRDGDLSQRATTNASEIGRVAGAFNDLIATFQSIIGKIYFNAEQVAKSAAETANNAETASTTSAEQRRAAETTAATVEQITSGLKDIGHHASAAADCAERSRELAEGGADIATRAAGEIERIATAVESSAAAITQLGERSRSIGGIVQVIHEIAEQTNMLALNAAIEAARAGEQGRGFAVVADEVRKLAERTSTATAEIASVITSIQSDTDAAVQSVRSGVEQARSGAGLARQAAEALSEINDGANSTLDTTREIARAIGEQTSGSAVILDQVHRIRSAAQSHAAGAQEGVANARQLEYLSVNLKEIGQVFRFGEAGRQALETHGSMPEVVMKAARDVERLLEQLIVTGRISEADLFDENYEPIPNTRPQKFHTRYDRLTDETFPSVQEPILVAHKHIVYAGAVDRKGYFPTHNNRFCKPLTGDEKVDMANNRTKRIFEDPIGKRCGSHQLPFLIQTYRRDTGEIMHDISAPIMVRGRQWGGFRIGYAA